MAVSGLICPPVVVVPGIKATALHDEYELPPEVVWTAVRRRHYDRIALHPINLRYELRGPSRVTAGAPFALAYEELVAELRENLSPSDSEPVPVYPFGYDWRMALRDTEQALAAFVDEVIERTSLLPHYRDSWFAKAPSVNLIGHSMGGLVIAGYIASLCKEKPDGSPVAKVVTIGTPFRGSHEAILKIATGIGELGDEPGKASERRMARMTPALYHMLPDFEGAVVTRQRANDDRTKGGAAGSDTDGKHELSTEVLAPSDIFLPETWQGSVMRTVADYVEKWGAPDGVSAEELFRAMLTEAKEYRNRIAQMKMNEVGSRWLAIVGSGAETRVRLEVVEGASSDKMFLLSSSGRADQWHNGSPEERYQTGDGTVPLLGSLPPFLDPASVVCVTPEDFGYWELRDRLLSGTAGFHGLLPRMNMLHRLIVRFFLDESDNYGNTWGRPLPDQVDRWCPPLALRNKDL